MNPTPNHIRERIVREAVETNAPIADIAERHGLSLSGARKILRQNGLGQLRNPPIPAEVKLAALADVAGQKGTLAQIADRYGITERWLRTLANRRGAISDFQ